jgi:hypothetical protein
MESIASIRPSMDMESNLTLTLSATSPDVAVPVTTAYLPAWSMNMRPAISPIISASSARPLTACDVISAIASSVTSRSDAPSGRMRNSGSEHSSDTMRGISPS